MSTPLNQPIFDLKSLLPPFHEHTLPSNGLYEGAPYKEINVRALTVRELKHLTAAGRFEKKVFDAQISSCVKESIDLQKLLIQDYNYLVYLVRLYTSGSESQGAKVCENCRKQFNFKFDITKNIEVELLDEVLPMVRTVTLPRFKENHGFEVTVDVKPLTRADYAKIDTAIKQSLETAARLNQPVSTFPLLELLKVHVVQISGFPVPLPKEQVLDYLEASEANIITSAYPDDKFGIKGQAEVSCPICNTEQKYPIPFTDLFFL
jgi:hypothetical protein